MPLENSTKICKGCKIEKPLSEFGKAQSWKGQPRKAARCKVCYNRYAMLVRLTTPELNRKQRREWSRNNRQKVRDVHLKSAHGMPKGSFEKLLNKQGRKCAICYLALGVEFRDSHIDHCHTTGKVRGILCRCCNWGLGHFKDDPVRMRQAIKYLRNAAKRQSQAWE